MCDFLETPYYIMCEFSKVCIFYFEQVKDNYLDVGKLFHISRLRFNFFIFDRYVFIDIWHVTNCVLTLSLLYYLYYYLICTISTKLSTPLFFVFSSKSFSSVAPSIWNSLKLSFMKINYVENTEIALFFGNTLYIGKMQEQY